MVDYNLQEYNSNQLHVKYRGEKKKKNLLLTGKDYNIMKEFPQYFLFKWVQWAQPVIEDKEQEVWLLQYSLKCNHLMQLTIFFLFLTVSLCGCS